MNKDMENTFNRMAELGGSDERIGTNTALVINAPFLPKNTRPAPAATDMGLVTVAKQWKVTAKNWSGFKPEISEPFDERELVTRSQADELLAAEREAQQRLLDIIEEANDDKEALEADNAAKDARIKELEAALDSDPSGSDLWRYWSRKACEASQKYVDEVDRAEALEAKLAAAEKALEPFVSFFNEAMKGFTEGYAERTPSDKPVLGWNNAYLLMRHFIEARAVLGGQKRPWEFKDDEHEL